VSNADELVDISPRSIPIQKDQIIEIDINVGELLITGIIGENVEVLGKAIRDEGFTFSIEPVSNNQVNIFTHIQKRIFRSFPEIPINLEVRIPQGCQVLIKTQEANINVKNFSGKLEVSSTAGNVFVDNLSGFASIKANRGDVTVQNSQGEIYALGNYGHLLFAQSHGRLSASTIMGTIRFNGTANHKDEIHLESDHGPIDTNLVGDPDLQVEVNSTSGEVVCSFLALKRNIRGCDGILGSGSGKLDIRSVSGNIRLQKEP